MLKLSHDDDARQTFRRACQRDGEAVLALPSLNSATLETFGLGRAASFHVLCNLGNPACHLETVERLLEHGVTVRSNPRLTTSMQATDGLVIVGATSPIDLGTDACRISAGVAVVSDDPALVSDVHRYIADLWHASDSLSVTREVLRSMRADRLDPSGDLLAPLEATTLLEACRERPVAFSNVYVVTSREGLDAADLQLVAEANRMSASDGDGDWEVRGIRMAGIEDFDTVVEIDRSLGRVHDSVVITGCLEPGFGDVPPLMAAIPADVMFNGRIYLISREERRTLLAASEQIATKARGRAMPLIEAMDIAEGRMEGDGPGDVLVEAA